MATYGVAKDYEESFGLKFAVEPEIEMEFGSKDTNSTKWDWSLPNLKASIESAVESGIKDKLLTGTKEDILEKIWAPWKNEQLRDYLNETYPLLNVSLTKEISSLMKEV